MTAIKTPFANRRATAGTELQADNTRTLAPAFRQRVQNVTSAGFVTRTQIGTKGLLGIAPASNYSIHAGPANNGYVYMRDSAGTETQICYIPTYYGSSGAAYPQLFWEVISGTKTVWFLSAGTTVVGSLRTLILRYEFTTGTTPNPNGNWTSVFDAAVGTFAMMPIINGTNIYWGEYINYNASQTNHPRVYQSTDAGLTWSVIYTVPYNCHVHSLAFGRNSDGTTNYSRMWIATGDGPGVPIIHLDYANGTWTATATSAFGGPDMMIPLKDGSLLTTGYVALIVDPTIGSSTPIFSFPIPTTNANSSYYKFAYGSGNLSPCFRQIKRLSNGLIVAGCYEYGIPSGWPYGGTQGSSEGWGGLYLSADEGQTWTCIVRSVTENGYHDLFGEMNGKLYANWTSGPHAITLPTASLVQALRLDCALPNIITDPATATFTTAAGAASVGQWTTGVQWWEPTVLPPATLEVTTGGRDGGNCLHVATQASSNRNYFGTRPCTNWSSYTAAQLDSKYHVLKCWIRSPNFASNYRVNISTSQNGDHEFYSVCLPGNEWTEIICCGQFRASPDYIFLTISVSSNDNASDSSAHAFDLYIDDVQLYVSDTPIYAIDCQNVLPGVTPANDHCVCELADDTGDWSVGFDWIGPSSPEWQAGVLASINSGDMSQHVNIGWNGTGYYITDGTHTATTTGTRARWHFDLTKFIVTYNASTATTTLYVYDPIVGLETVATTSIVFTKPPKVLWVGCDHTEANQMPGRYWNLQQWTSLLASGDVATQMATPGVGAVGYYDYYTLEAGRNTDPGAANVRSGVSYKIGDASQTGSYPTTEASQAAQYATDAAAVSAKKSFIYPNANILGKNDGTLRASNIGTLAGTDNLVSLELAFGTTVDNVVGAAVLTEDEVASAVSSIGANVATLQSAVSVVGSNVGTLLSRLGTPETTIASELSSAATDAHTAATAAAATLDSADVQAACAAAVAATPVVVEKNNDKAGYSLTTDSGALPPNAAIAANDIHATAFRDGTTTLRARVFFNGANLKSSDVATISYSIYLLNDSDKNYRLEVDGHAAVSLSPADVIFDSMQTDGEAACWNFKHMPSIAAHPAFATAGRHYLVEYKITPTAGEIVLVRFVVKVI
jgi:hypothetical protein